MPYYNLTISLNLRLLTLNFLRKLLFLLIPLLLLLSFCLQMFWLCSSWCCIPSYIIKVFPGCIIRFSSAKTLHKLLKVPLHFLQSTVCYACPWKISVIPEDHYIFARQEFVPCFHMDICIVIRTVEVKWKCTVIFPLKCTVI